MITGSDKSFNVIISSRNKLADETNNKVSVKLNDPIHIREDEECQVCLKLFHSTKTFYNCQDGINNAFKIVVYNNNQNHQGEILHDWDITIPEGNYNVTTLLAILKTLCFEKLNIEYDSRLNKFLFTNAHHGNNHTHLEVGNAGAFLGYDDNATIHFDDITSSHYSDYPINVAGFDNLLIEMAGNVALTDTLTNIKNAIGNNLFKSDRILGIITVSDIMPMDSIKYENDGCLYSSKVASRVIDKFEISVVNEKLQNISIGDWYIVLGFTITRNNDIAIKIYKLMDMMYQQLDDIVYYCMKLMSMMGIYPMINKN